MKLLIFVFRLYILKLKDFLVKYSKIIFLLLLVLSTILISVYPLRISFLRLSSSIKDLGLSIAYIFIKIFNINSNIKPSIINNISNYNKSTNESIPSLPNIQKGDITNKFQLFFINFFNINYFNKYNVVFSGILLSIVQAILIFIMFYFLLSFL